MRERSRLRVALLLIAVVCVFLVTGCSCGDPSSNAGQADDDTALDDDSIDDDDSVDNSSDDDADDDSIDDDDTGLDDDTGFDDDSAIDDDTESDDDTALPDDPSETLWDKDGLLLQRVWGGFPNLTSEAFVLASNGDRHVVAGQGRCVVHYKVTPEEEIAKETLAYFASSPAVAIDTDDRLHVLYLDLRGAKLVYATNRSGAWTREIISDYILYRENGAVQFVVDVDDMGYVHLGLEDAVRGGYSYGTNESGAWEFEVLDPFGTTNIGSYDRNKALVVDNTGTVHYAFHHFSTDGYVFRYARKAPGEGWTMETARDGGSPYIDMTLDADGQPVIAWIENGIIYDNVWLTHRTDDGWVDELLPIETQSRRLIDVRLLNGELQIVTRSDFALTLWHQISGQWAGEAMEAPPYLIDYSVSHANETNFAEIAFSSSPVGLFLAQFDGTNWQVSSKMQDGFALSYPHTDSAVWGDRLDVAFQHFIYQPIDEDTWRNIGEIWAARRQNDRWVVEKVGTGQGPSLDLDSAGARYISAADPSEDDAPDSLVLLFDNVTGAWRERTVETAPDDPGYPAYKIETSVDLTPDDVVNVVAAGIVGDVSWGDLGVTWSWGDGDTWHTDVWNWFSAVTGYADVRLLMAPDGTPHVIGSFPYFNFFSIGRFLVTLWKTPLGWQRHYVEVGPTETEYGLGMDAVMGEDGTIYVTYGYRNSTGVGGRLATGSKGSWTIEDLTDPTESISVESTAVAFGPDGRLYVAYADAPLVPIDPLCCEVHAMVLQDSTWLDKVVDWGGHVGSNSGMDLTVDASAMVHLLYGGEQSLWYVRFGDDFLEAD